MYARLDTIEFGTASRREEALKLLGAAVQKCRAMPGFEAAYYLDDADGLRIISVLMFDNEANLESAHWEDDELRRRAREIGVEFPRTEIYRVMAFATNTE